MGELTRDELIKAIDHATDEYFNYLFDSPMVTTTMTQDYWLAEWKRLQHQLDTINKEIQL